MLAVVLATGLGWQVPRACSGARAASACRARSIGLQLPTERTGDTFLAVIELGEGDGTVTHEFRPYFSSSALITMRYPVPHTLEAEPIQGVIKVTQAGDGLFEGDVRHPPTRSHRRPHAAALTPPSSHRRSHATALTRCELRRQVLRAFSTLEMRYDSGAKEVRFGDGSLGLSPGLSPSLSLSPSPSLSPGPGLSPSLTPIPIPSLTRTRTPPLTHPAPDPTLPLLLTRCASATASSARTLLTASSAAPRSTAARPTRPRAALPPRSCAPSSPTPGGSAS